MSAKRVLGALLAVLFLTGCGNGEVQTAETERGGSAGTKEATGDFWEGQWSLRSEPAEAESMWSVAEYAEGFLPEAAGRDLGLRFSCVDAARYAVLTEFYSLHDGEQTREFFLTEYDTDTMSGVTESFSLKASETQETENAEVSDALSALREMRGNIVGMDAADGVYTFFVQIQDDSGEAQQLTALNADRSGTVTKAAALLPALSENGFRLSANSFPGECLADGAGRFYVSDPEQRTVYVLDCDGVFLTKLEAGGEMLSCCGQLPDQTPVFSYTQGEQTALTAFDGAQTKILYCGEWDGGSSLCFGDGGSIFYLQGTKLLTWNTADGSLRILTDHFPVDNCEAVFQNTAGELLIAFWENGEQCLIRLKDEPEKESVKIELYALVMDEYVSRCAVEYGKRHPGVEISVRMPDEAADAVFLNRLAQEIADGSAPALLLLRREQLLTLQEKGLLERLDGVLPDETKAQLFDGVLENGMADGALYGITCEATVSTLLVPEETWSGEAWMLADVEALLLAENEAEDFAEKGYDTTAAQMLYDLVLTEVSASPFLDAESRSCCFDSPEFEAVLKLCKTYGKETIVNDSRTEKERAELLTEGKALAYVFDGGLIAFSRAMASLGENYRSVGYPSQSGSGSYLNFYGGCVAVSAGAADREIIDDFLRYLLDAQTQQRYGTDWVRKDVLSSSVRERVEIYGEKEPVPVFVKGGTEIIPLSGRADGSSYLPEYLALLEKSVPRQTQWDTVTGIVLEEAAAYFSGDKTARDVATVIQNRVQLLLAE